MSTTMNEAIVRDVHPVDEVLPAGKLTVLGLQHVLVMYAGAIAVPLIVGRANGVYERGEKVNQPIL